MFREAQVTTPKQRYANVLECMHLKLLAIPRHFSALQAGQMQFLSSSSSSKRVSGSQCRMCGLDYLYFLISITATSSTISIIVQEYRKSPLWTDHAQLASWSKKMRCKITFHHGWNTSMKQALQAGDADCTEHASADNVRPAAGPSEHQCIQIPATILGTCMGLMAVERLSAAKPITVTDVATCSVRTQSPWGHGVLNPPKMREAPQGPRCM